MMIQIRDYTNEELEYIKNNYSNLTVRKIAANLNKTENSIKNAARKLGLQKQFHSPWTDEDIEFLKINYINMTSEEISHYINHSISAINTMRDRLGLVRNANWSLEEIDILKNNFETMLFCDLSKMLGRSEGALRAKCFDLKLFKKTPWSEDEIEFVKSNYMEMKTSEISQKLSRTMNAIELKARKLGLKKYPYTCDYNYFNVIDTEDKAYWLGFLAADGWVSKNQNTGAGVVGITLQYGDIDHLKKFNKAISGNYKITDSWKPCLISTKDKNKKHHCCNIRVFSAIMYDDLCRLGFTNNKSYTGAVPNIDKTLIRHYMRGFFDGDGTLCYTNKTFHVSFTTASEHFCDDITSIIQKCGIVVRQGCYINDFGTRMYTVNIDRQQDKITFLDWIYADCNTYLDRKYKKYLKAKKVKD